MRELRARSAAAGPPEAQRLQVAPLRWLFGAFGVAIGSWGAQMPALSARHGLDEGRLSMVLLAAACGAVACLLTAPQRVARHGPRRCAQIGALGLCGVIGLALQGRSQVLLYALMLGLGIATALLDVAVNAEANRLELSLGRKLMSRMHAMWSLGCMGGALMVSGLHRLGIDAAWQLAAMALFLAPLLLTAARHLDGPGDGAEPPQVPRCLPGATLLGMGLIGALAMVAEGAVYDWGALFLQQERHGSAAYGALGFGCFAAAMTLGRVQGDAVRSRIAPAPLLVISGGLTALGMAAALLTPDPAWALAGFACAGLGLANIVPIVFAAAGQHAGMPPAQGVATVSAVGYAGFLIGPPLIGLLARTFGLGQALWVLVLAGLLIAAAASRVLRRS